MDTLSIKNQRDKLVIIGVVSIALFVVVLIGILSLRAEVEVPIVLALAAIVSSTVTGLFGVYKGSPSPPDISTTTETTTSSTNTEGQDASH